MKVVLRITVMAAYFGVCTIVHAQAEEDENASRAEARTHFERGIELYQDHDFTAALVEFRRAYEMLPNYRVLYNLGVTSVALHQYAEARGYFERYLRDGSEQVSDVRRREVEVELERLEGRVAAVRIVVSPAGSQIVIDGEEVGTAPLEAPVAVSAGRREVRVSAEGYRGDTQLVEVVGGEERELVFRLSREARAADPVPVSLGWVTGILSILTGAAAVASGLFTLESNETLVAALEMPRPDPVLVAAHRNDIRTFGVLTDIFAGIAAASGIAAITFTAVALGSSNDEPAPEAPRARLQLAPLAMSVEGVF